METDNKKVFRKSFRGFKKKDVYSYIERLNAQYKDELEKEQRLATEEKGKKEDAEGRFTTATEELNELKVALENATAATDRATEERDAVKTQLLQSEEAAENLKKELESTASERDQTISELKKEIEELKNINAGLEKLSGEQAATISSMKQQAIAEKNAFDSPEAIKKAKGEAALIIARAEREASLIKLQTKKQRENLSKIIDDELEVAINKYIDEYTRQTNDIFAGLSVEYKKLYSDSTELHDKMIRSRASVAEKAKARILRMIDRVSLSDPFGD